MMRIGQLIVLQGAEHHLHQVFLLPGKQERLMGRSSMCNFWLDDSLASSLHCLFCYKDQQFLVKDLLSANGVLVNNEIIDISPLNEGDKVKIGKTVLEFSLHQDPKESSVAQKKQQRNTHKLPLGRMIKSHRDINICRLAIKNNMLHHQQIRDILEELGGESAQDITEILIKKDILSKKDSENLVREHNFYKILNKDLQLAKMVTQAKILDQEKVDECLALQRKYFDDMNQIPRLGEIMVQKGYITVQVNNRLIKALIKKKQDL